MTDLADRRYAWADNLGCMEAGAEIARVSPQIEARQESLRGLLVCGTLAAVSIALARAPVWPFTLEGDRHPLDAVMLAIVLGMLLGNVWSVPGWLQPGIKLATKGVLPLGIVLLGAQLDLMALADIGAAGLVLSVLVIAAAIGLLLGLGAILGLPVKLATLLGVGTGICGGSAIVAVAPVIDAEEKEIAFAVATVALLGFAVMFALPLAGHLLAMDQTSFGVWAGLTIHQTPQVVAAGFTYGPEAGGVATLVKLVRLSLLAPAVFVIGLVYTRARGTGGGGSRLRTWQLVPGFVVGLFALVALRTLGLLPDLTLSVAEDSLLGARELQLSSVGVAASASKLCIVVAMAGVGLETKLAALRETGLRPLLAALAAALVLIVASLAAIRFLGIG
ncbi:MAG: putative sulfate exporter family transporter [Myxococcota bacterium]